MANSTLEEGGPPAAGGKRRIGRLLLSAGVTLGLAGAIGVGAAIVPGLMKAMAAAPSAAPAADKPVFVDVPEMALTLPNDGQPRQLRIKLTLEMSPSGSSIPPSEILLPRVYDTLLTYLRTAHDDELAGSLALDQLRGDILRRLDLVLGTGAVRDVLITSLVVG